MTWLTDILERNGIVPARAIAEQVLDAIPKDAIRGAVLVAATDVLDEYGVGDLDDEMAIEIAGRAVSDVLLALEDANVEAKSGAA